MVERVEDEVGYKGMEDTKLSIFIHTVVTKSAFDNWNSSSEMWLYLLDIQRGLHLHIIHVTETCMKAQGMDGLSLGSLMEWVMARRSILECIPLDETALEILAEVFPWLRTW